MVKAKNPIQEPQFYVKKKCSNSKIFEILEPNLINKIFKGKGIDTHNFHIYSYKILRSSKRCFQIMSSPSGTQNKKTPLDFISQNTQRTTRYLHNSMCICNLMSQEITD